MLIRSNLLFGNMRIKHDDGSLRGESVRERVDDIISFFEGQSNLTETEQDFVDLLRHTIGTPILEITRAPFDDYLDTVYGSGEKLQDIGSRLNELSEEIASENETYAQIYQERAEELFEAFEDARTYP